MYFEKCWGDDNPAIDRLFLERELKDEIDRRKELIRDMKETREYFREIHNADQVRYARAYDIYGNRIPSEKLTVAIYVRNIVH